MVFGGVETKDILTLPGPRIDCSHVFATLHLPNCGDHPVLFNGVIGDILTRRDRCGTLGCYFSRAFNWRGLVLRHIYGSTPLKTSQLVLWFKELLHTARAGVHQTANSVLFP